MAHSLAKAVLLVRAVQDSYTIVEITHRVHVTQVQNNLAPPKPSTSIFERLFCALNPSSVYSSVSGPMHQTVILMRS